MVLNVREFTSVILSLMETEKKKKSQNYSRKLKRWDNGMVKEHLFFFFFLLEHSEVYEF